MMDRNRYDLHQVSSPTEYTGLLECLLPHASILGVVSDSATTAASLSHGQLANLNKYKIREESVLSWPGSTSLGDRPSTRFTYEFCHESILVWVNLVHALYGERAFELSDFHLLRADGSTVLATISSHEVAWLEMGEFEFHELISKVPNSFRTLLLSDKKQAGEVIPLGVLAGSEIGGQLRESDLRALMGRVPGDVQANLVAYLRACEVVVPVMGPTADVISGAFTIANGADLLSDGNYVWRRDAADYVERYGVEVPMEAIVRWQAENWRVASLRVDEIDDISNFIWSGGL